MTCRCGPCKDSLRTSFAVLEPELEENPRVLSIGIHPHIAGVPHRMYYLEKALDMLMSRNDTIFVTSDRIADWFVSVDKSGRDALEAAMKTRG